jgi:large subunit ribosomal protein L36e
MSSEGVAVGLKKGHVVTKIEKVVRPSNTKGRISKRTKLVRELIGEVAGLSPYEKRLLDMLKTGGASSEKRMYKYAKRRVSKFYYMDILLFNNSLVVGFSLIIIL